MKNPVISQKQYKREELTLEIKKYLSQSNAIKEQNKIISNGLENYDIDISECQIEYVKTIQQVKQKIDCPLWSNWETSDCSESCGQGIRNKTRKCLQSNTEVSVEVCKSEFDEDNSTFQKEESCFLKECEITSWKEGFKISKVDFSLL